MAGLKIPEYSTALSALLPTAPRSEAVSDLAILRTNTKDNEDVHRLLSSRLQLPAAMAF